MNINKYHEVLFRSFLNKFHNRKKILKKCAKYNRHTIKKVSFTLSILLCTTLLKNFNTNSFLVLATGKFFLVINSVYIVLFSIQFRFYYKLTAANDDNTIDSDQPYFDDINPRNITTVEDESAILKCRVKNKGNRTVSFIFNFIHASV